VGAKRAQRSGLRSDPSAGGVLVTLRPPHKLSGGDLAHFSGAAAASAAACSLEALRAGGAPTLKEAAKAAAQREEEGKEEEGAEKGEGGQDEEEGEAGGGGKKHFEACLALCLPARLLRRADGEAGVGGDGCLRVVDESLLSSLLPTAFTKVVDPAIFHSVASHCVSLCCLPLYFTLVSPTAFHSAVLSNLSPRSWTRLPGSS